MECLLVEIVVILSRNTNHPPPHCSLDYAFQPIYVLPYFLNNSSATTRSVSSRKQRQIQMAQMFRGKRFGEIFLRILKL